MKSIDEEYIGRLQDPFNWIYTAKKHIVSARCLEKRMNEIINIDPDLDNEEINFEFQALMNSCLFLLGIGLENAIKGYVVAQSPTIKSINELNNSTSGHRITDMYRVNCSNIYISHKSFLDRIQEYLFWIGKYSIPTDSKFLILSTDYFCDDVKTAVEIIDEIEKLIISIPSKNIHN